MKIKKRFWKEFKKRIDKRFIKKKKAQQILGLSFGVIFSIILIVFFIFIAIIVINSFLKAQGCAKVGLFIDDLEADVKKSWNSQTDSHVFKGFLPSGIMYVCFADLSGSFVGDINDEEIWRSISLYEGKNANMFFYPTGKSCEMPYKNIEHLDIEDITMFENPYCIAVDRGRVDFKVEKKLNNRFVGIER